MPSSLLKWAGRGFVVAVALAGCGRVGYAPQGGTADGAAAMEDASSADASAAPDAGGELRVVVDPSAGCFQTETLDEAPPGPVGATLSLSAGLYRLTATGGAVNYADGSPCYWSWRIQIHAAEWDTPQFLYGTPPDPPECSSRTWAWMTEAGAESGAEGNETEFSISAETEVSFYTADSNCTDNIGSLEASLQPL